MICASRDNYDIKAGVGGRDPDGGICTLPQMHPTHPPTLSRIWCRIRLAQTTLDPFLYISGILIKVSESYAGSLVQGILISWM